jgi:hypothetical protein
MMGKVRKIRFVVEKNVPVGEVGPGGFGFVARVVRRMRKGDSVVVPDLTTAKSFRKAAGRMGFRVMVRGLGSGLAGLEGGVVGPRGLRQVRHLYSDGGGVGGRWMEP